MSVIVDVSICIRLYLLKFGKPMVLFFWYTFPLFCPWYTFPFFFFLVHDMLFLFFFFLVHDILFLQVGWISTCVMKRKLFVNLSIQVGLYTIVALILLWHHYSKYCCLLAMQTTICRASYYPKDVLRWVCHLQDLKL